MSKELYEEALADAKKLREVAEDDAKRSVLEAVTPRIRELIERQLLTESFDDEEEFLPAAAVPAVGDAGSVAAAMSPPDVDGKVTLDLDALSVDSGTPVEQPMFGAPAPGADNVEYELSYESVAALSPVINATKSNLGKELESSLYRLGESIEQFASAGKLVRESKGYASKIAQMISRVENMYDYVQESVSDPAMKSSYEIKLENYFRELNKLRERKMSKKSLKDLMNEGDVTLKLTGLPDEIDLDSVGVDLVTGEDEEGSSDDLGGEGGDDLDLGGDEGGEGGEGGDDLGLDDLGLGGDDEEAKMESRKLSDDTIVEIDTNMLRREISRLKRMHEDAVPSADGNGADAVLDQFGDGKSEGDPWLDGEVTTEAEESDDEDSLEEADGPDGDLTMDETDDVMEMDGLAQLGNRRSKDENGNAVADSHETPMESLKRRVSFEKRLQERAKARGAALRKEARVAAAKKQHGKVASLKKEYDAAARRFTESVNRQKKIMRTLAEATSRKGATVNGSSKQPAERMAEANLRKELAATNLFNAKLVYTNKLLQNESLSKKQKSEVIKRLDEANSLREVKLVYESLSKALAGTSRPIKESADRKVVGSSSRVTRPASTTTLNEGSDLDRWAKLAGL